ENIVVTVERMKDGPEGDSLISKLESIEVGADSDGDPITSCVLVSVEGDAAHPATNRKLSDRQRLALDALTDCAAEQGKPPPSRFRLPAGLLAVALNQWRDGLHARGTEPPPLKWSDLTHVFDIKGGCNGQVAIQALRDRREVAAGRCSGLRGPEHGGRNPPDRRERGDVLSVAPGVRWAEDRAGEAPEGP